MGEKSQSGSIHLFRVDGSSSRPTVLHERQLDVKQDGIAVEVTYMDAGSQNVVIYANENGSIVGWDLRSPSPYAWKLQNRVSHGLITALDVNPSHCWMAVGTSQGSIACWDLRFQLPVSVIFHPSARRVRRVLATPHKTDSQSGVIASLQSNNEVSFWDLETRARQKTIWASVAPALSEKQVTKHSFNGIYFGRSESNAFLLSAGSDMRIRHWDLTEPSNCFMVAQAAKDDPVRSPLASYRSQLIDGTEVLAETYAHAKSERRDVDVPARGYDTPRAGHRDVITDLNLCKPSQCLMITSSYDGVVKVWK